MNSKNFCCLLNSSVLWNCALFFLVCGDGVGGVFCFGVEFQGKMVFFSLLFFGRV